MAPDLWPHLELQKVILVFSKDVTQDGSQKARQHCLLEHSCFIQPTFYKNEIYTVKYELSCLCIFFLPLMYLCLSIHLLIHLSTYLIIYHLLSFSLNTRENVSVEISSILLFVLLILESSYGYVKFVYTKNQNESWSWKWIHLFIKKTWEGQELVKRGNVVPILT